MKISYKIAAATFVAVAGSSGLAQADSQLFPGVSTGIPLGAALPEGVWGVGIVTQGTRDIGGNDLKVTATVPWFIWSTPWKVAGANLVFDTVTPYVDVGMNDNGIASGWSNTFLDAQLKWNLGSGWFGGFQAGVYLPSSSDTGRDWSSFQGVGAISYLGNGYNLSATMLYGTGKDNKAPDWLNLDVTATKTFGKWELGAVGFMSRDLDDAIGYRARQIAIGPLVGYDFGKFKLQGKYTKTVSEKNYGGDDSRFWLTVVTPLWMPKK